MGFMKSMTVGELRDILSGMKDTDKVTVGSDEGRYLLFSVEKSKNELTFCFEQNSEFDGEIVESTLEEKFEFLDAVRDSGITNMYGASPFLEARFGISATEAKQVLVEWMRTFSQRHPVK